MTILKDLKTAIIILLVFTILLGIIYPLFIAGVSHLAFPKAAQGSIVRDNDKIIGSQLIGQNFTSEKYFHGRPSNAGNGYDAASSGASNLAATNKTLIQNVHQRVQDVQKFNQSSQPVPMDLVMASGSGLDPDISPEAAYYQAARIAKQRNLSENVVRQFIERHIQTPWIPFLGAAHVNVLQLNLALDKLKDSGHNTK